MDFPSRLFVSADDLCSWNELNADAGLIVVAGSDTSSSVMSMVLYSLVCNPVCAEQVRKELQSVFDSECAG